MPTDLEFMRRALALAESAAGLAAPNPLVGAVVVRAGQIVGEGAHVYAERVHAEARALAAAGEAARGATLYINLEPCSHQGRTPPCTEAVVRAGIRRVVAAMADPNPLVAGSGFARLRAAGIEVETGLLESEARELNEGFCRWIVERRPFVTLKAALSLDGKVSPPPESRQRNNPFWLTGEEARAQVQRLRHGADAILAGIGTVLADDPLLTDRSRLPRRRPLIRIVLDTNLRLPRNSQLVQSAQEDLWVACGEAASPVKRRELEAAGVRVVPIAAASGPNASGRGAIHELLRRLGEEEVLNLMVEGGAAVFASFLRARLADKLWLFYAPTILGAGLGWLDGAGELHLRLEQPRVHRFGADLAVVGYCKQEIRDEGPGIRGKRLTPDS